MILLFQTFIFLVWLFLYSCHLVIFSFDLKYFNNFSTSAINSVWIVNSCGLTGVFTSKSICIGDPWEAFSSSSSSSPSPNLRCVEYLGFLTYEDVSTLCNLTLGSKESIKCLSFRETLAILAVLLLSKLCLEEVFILKSSKLILTVIFRYCCI